ncbi:hypothetical protein BDL97_04G060700 [Sphagnum fallax]|nr:hypothetical protein BDL97_04G060700 [Sphagnum fallax]
MASSGINIQSPANGVNMIAIRGAVHHLLGPLAPPQGSPHQFAQLYIIDNADAQGNVDLDYRILHELEQMLLGSNVYVQRFVQAMDLPPQDLANYEIVIRVDDSVDRRRHNAPTSSEVAVLMPGNGDPDGDLEGSNPRDIRVRARGGRLWRISDAHCAYDPLHFVLLHPHGEPGWHPNIIGATPAVVDGLSFEDEQQQPSEDEQQPDAESAVDPGRGGGRIARKVTTREYTAYFMHDRNPPTNNTFTYGKRLYQEWVVDQYSKVEGQRLRWQDGVNNTNFGRMVVLPATFAGSPRHMNQLYQDSMAFVRKFRKPDLFITMTCNPNWPEILHELRIGEEANDRLDLTSRVFNMKLNALLKDLLQNCVLGTAKRGLPHGHILIILCSQDKPNDNNDYDRIMCAELPDKSTHPELYNIVTSRMLHGPRGALHPSCPCMVNGVCSKGYPKTFQPQTKDSTGSYPTYRRWDDGRTFTHPTLLSIPNLKKRAKPNLRERDTKVIDNLLLLPPPPCNSGFVFDNHWVVPYNPYLTMRYQCHINVEVCSSIIAVKYFYKYVYKGHDRALAVVQPKAGALPAVAPQPAIGGANGNNVPAAQDEVQNYLDGRYVSASETCHRLFAFDLHGMHPNVYSLAVHLPNEQTTYFPEGTTVREAMMHNNSTTLTGWWATCFEDLRTTHRPHMPTTVVHPTFKVAYLARGLLQDDAKWDQCLSETIGVQLPRSLQQLFASLLIYNNVTNPGRLWDMHKGALTEDFLHQARQRSIYDNVIDAVHDPRPVDKTFFVDGLGGADKTFLYRCLLSMDMLFGNKVVVMGGDFRQILPVVPRGTRGQIVDASLKRSTVLWHRVKGGANTTADAQQQQAWADYLQRIGEGTKQVFPEVGEEAVLIPKDMCCQGDTIDSLVDEVYGDLGRFTDS